MIVQTLLHGEEWTVSIYIDNAGRLRAVVPHRRIKIRAGETLPFENLSDFFSLPFWFQLDMTMLYAFESSPIVMLSFRAEIVAGGHRKTVGEQVREAQNQHDPV